jgi:hypothetical protein
MIYRVTLCIGVAGGICLQYVIDALQAPDDD